MVRDPVRRRRLLGLALALAGLAGLAAPGSSWAAGGSTFTPLADISVVSTGTGTTLQTANQGRIGLVCTNTDATIHVRLGSTTTVPTTTKGVQLRAGASITVTSTAAIRAIAESGTVTVACTEETR